MPAQHMKAPEQAREDTSPAKIDVTSKSPVGDISVVTLLDQLTAVVNLLAQGRACPSIAPLLAGAGLVALPKPSGGIRPIAVGELLRRLTGKCLMQAVRPEARDHFWPAQAGVAVPGGAEAAVHGLRAWVSRHAASHDSVVVKVDFQNAFNTVSRDVVLHRPGTSFPLWPAGARGATSTPPTSSSETRSSSPTAESSKGIPWDPCSLRLLSIPWLQRFGPPPWTFRCSTWTMGCWLGPLMR